MYLKNLKSLLIQSQTSLITLFATTHLHFCLFALVLQASGYLQMLGQLGSVLFK